MFLVYVYCNEGFRKSAAVCMEAIERFLLIVMQLLYLFLHVRCDIWLQDEYPSVSSLYVCNYEQL